MCRGSFGVRYVRPATMLKTNGTKLRMKNKKSFHRVRRISLYSAITETFDNNEFLKLFWNFNIEATERDINEFVAIDDKSSHLFKEEILEEANLLFFEEQQAVNKDENR